MSVMMDYVASGIVFAILAVSVARIQVNINSTLYENTFSLRVQSNAVQLALQLEHDILKAGYHVSSGAISLADTTRLTFQSDMNNTNSVATYTYATGDSTQMAFTSNVHDFPLLRNSVQQNWGLISFKFAYFDSAMNKMSTPVNATNRPNIRGIQASFIIQSPEPVLTSYDTTWPAVTWQKTMMPRNLGVIQ